MGQPEGVDQIYLSRDQYRDFSNLGKRCQLHDRYSTNPCGWHPWVFDQLELPPQCRILEVGCGGARLWVDNRSRVPAGWQVALSDFSHGMVLDARAKLEAAGSRFQFQVFDAAEIPYEDGCLDGVIANHMLYHLPDRQRALGEIHRVLHPGGVLYSSTNGRGHLKELGDLVRRFDASYAAPAEVTSELFSIENAPAQLSRWFSDIALRQYDDSLVITEAEGLVAWAESWATLAFKGRRFCDLLAFLRQQFLANGPISVTKSAGIFISRKDP